MKIQLLLTTMIVCASVALTTGCHSTLNHDHSHRAICGELRHRIIFNGSTSNDAKAFAQRAEYDKLSREYHDEKCD